MSHAIHAANHVNSATNQIDQGRNGYLGRDKPVEYHVIAREEDQYTIEHFYAIEPEKSQNGKKRSKFERASKAPYLGRFSLMNTKLTSEGFSSLMKSILKNPWLQAPVLLTATPAWAYLAPPGFDDFEPIHQVSAIQQIIEFNKSFLVAVQSAIDGS